MLPKINITIADTKIEKRTYFTITEIRLSYVMQLLAR